MAYSRIPIRRSSLLFVLGCFILMQGSLRADANDPLYEVTLASTHRATTKTTNEEEEIFEILPASSFKTTTKTTCGETAIIPIASYKTTTKTTQRERGSRTVTVSDWSSSSLHTHKPISKQMHELEELSQGVPHPLFHSGVQVGTFLIDGETNTLTLQLSRQAEFEPGTEISLFSFEHDLQTSWELVVLDEKGTPIDALAEERINQDGRMAYVLIFESAPCTPAKAFKGRLARTFFC